MTYYDLNSVPKDYAMTFEVIRNLLHLRNFIDIPLNISNYIQQNIPYTLIEIALAGFYKNEITVGVVKEKLFSYEVGRWVNIRKLEIKAEKNTKIQGEYFVQTLSQCSVQWSRTLPQNSKVKEVKLKQGILSIIIELSDLERQEERKIKYLKIK